MIERTGNDLVVIASDPQELVESQHAMIERIRQKEGEVAAEINDTFKAIEEAEAANIKCDGLNRVLRKQESRKLYLGKVVQALEAGYVIVPNFNDARVVAIRVKEGRQPKGRPVMSYYQRQANVNDEEPDALPVGEGKYVSPRPTQDVELLEAEKKEDQRWLATPFEMEEGMDLPIEFLKPTVIQRTGRCAMRKIFDEIAVTPGFLRRRDDPMVIGRIRDKRNDRMISFLVAWFVDSAAI